MKRLVSILLIAVTVFAFAACGKEKAEEITLVGSWKYDGSLDYTYIFEDDGNGAYAYGDTKMEFTYKDNGDSVEILYTGNTEPNVFKYTIEGKKLSIEDSFGEYVDYIRK